MQVVVPNSGLLAQLTELSTTPNLFFGAKLHLFKTQIPLQPSTPLASLVEADFSGYAPSSAITWSAPHYQSSGVPVLVGDLKTFVSADPVTVPNTIYGSYITDSAGTVLLWAQLLTTPVSITSPSQAVVILPSYPAFSPNQ